MEFHSFGLFVLPISTDDITNSSQGLYEKEIHFDTRFDMKTIALEEFIDLFQGC